jgi:hypothetical protein
MEIGRMSVLRIAKVLRKHGSAHGFSVNPGAAMPVVNGCHKAVALADARTRTDKPNEVNGCEKCNQLRIVGHSETVGVKRTYRWQLAVGGPPNDPLRRFVSFMLRDPFFCGGVALTGGTDAAPRKAGRPRRQG